MISLDCLFHLHVQKVEITPNNSEFFFLFKTVEKTTSAGKPLLMMLANEVQETTEGQKANTKFIWKTLFLKLIINNSVTCYIVHKENNNNLFSK